MRRITFWILMLSIPTLLLLGAAPASASEASATLRGSRASMLRQNGIARENEFTFLRTPAQVREFAEEGYLIELAGNEDYDIALVSFPYARPEVRTFIERFSAQYREATGGKLVVTSLTRPASRQPGNAHALSVHPAGMAVDLRVPASAESRRWLEESLLALEAQGVLDVTRERRPPHYHVAVYPDAYRAHVAERVAAEAAARRDRPAAARGATRFASTAPAPPAAVVHSGARRLYLAAPLLALGIMGAMALRRTRRGSRATGQG